MQKIIVMLALTWMTFMGHSLIAQSVQEQKVVELLEIMQTEDQFLTSMKGMLEMQKESPQTAMLPDGFYEEFIKEAEKGFETDLLPQLIIIYKNNFTTDQIDQLIQFYKTETGQMLLTKMPAIQNESANAGMIWGQELGMKVAQKLMKE